MSAFSSLAAGRRAVQMFDSGFAALDFLSSIDRTEDLIAAVEEADPKQVQAALFCCVVLNKLAEWEVAHGGLVIAIDTPLSSCRPAG